MISICWSFYCLIKIISQYNCFSLMNIFIESMTLFFFSGRMISMTWNFLISLHRVSIHLISKTVRQAFIIDLSQCCQLRTLKMSIMKEEEFAAVRPSIMPHLQDLAIEHMRFNQKIFFERLATEQFSFLTTLTLNESKFRSRYNFQPTPYVKSLSGICCMWEDFQSIFPVFPQLRRLSLSL
jgi:hypothetical protein